MFRHVYPRDELHPSKRPPFQQVWFKLGERIGDAPELHRALLAYASDFHLIGPATFPHGISYYQPNVLMASLDHAMWFHRPFRVDEWMLYSCDSPTAQAGRGLARGMIYDTSGALTAAAAPEGLMRMQPAPGDAWSPGAAGARWGGGRCRLSRRPCRRGLQSSPWPRRGPGSPGCR